MIEPKKLTEISGGKGLFKYSLVALFLMVSSTIFSADYFWVGNSGNWNDNSHWALSSGGNGGAGIPSANDDVYFDANSFTVNSLVQINNNAICKDFNWEGTNGKQEISGTGDLNVHGSFIVQDELKNEFLGEINLLAQSGSKVIKAGQLQWKSNFTINGGATFLLDDALVTTKTNSISLVKGVFNTNGNLMYTGTFQTESNSQKNILLGSSTIRIFEEWNVETGSNISLDGGSSDLQLLESIPQNQIKKGNFQYGAVTNKVACGNGIDFTVTVTSNYNGADVSCTGDCDGEITVTINGGGGGPYGYEGTGGLTLQSSNVFTANVCATTYNITVYDTSQVIVPGVFESCTEFGVEVDDPAPIGINVQGFTEPTCPGDCDGSIFTSIGGGTGALDIQWPTINPLPFIGEDPIGVVCAGDHDVTVTDVNGCTFTTSVTLTDPPAITPTLVVSPVSCNGECDGEILASATGGNGNPYTYAWDGGLTPGDSLATGLCELDSYTVTITDALLCTTTATETVPDKDSTTITVVSTTNPTCFGLCNGEISVIFQNLSDPSMSFAGIDWAVGTLGSGGVVFASNVFSVNTLCANVNYLVYVTDQDGCVDSLQLPMLTQPTEIIMSVTDSTNLLCAGDGNGMVDITTVGGTPIPAQVPAYDYEWTVVVAGGGEITTDEDQFTLIGGDYQVVATDDLGCTDTVLISIFEPDSIFANGILTDNLCWDDLSASIDLTTSGGMGPGVYTWTWVSSDGGFVDPGTEDLINLDSGSYTVTIVDTNFCSYDTTFLVTTPGEIFVNGVVTNANCGGASTGSIDISPVNGVGTYDFDWDNLPGGLGVDPEDQLGTLPQGAYTVTIEDDNGCQVDSTMNISDPTPISGVLTPSNSSCGGTNGSIIAVISGGSGDFTYEWFDGGGNPVGGNSATITGAADCYDLVYTDVLGCVYTDQECIIDDAAPTGIFVPQDLTCFENGSGAIDATISGGVLPYASITWASTNPTFVDPGTEDLFGIGAGDYTITVTDASGCVYSETTTINEPDEIVAGASIVSDIQCFGNDDGAIDIAVTGGTVAGAYGYTWTGPAFNSVIEDVSPLAPGTYCVHVEDDLGCFLDTCFDINEPVAVIATFTSNPAQCGVNDGDATVSGSGGVGTIPTDYTYDWFTLPALGSFQGFLGAGVYPVEVTDANGCADTVQVTISEDLGPTIVLDDSTLVSCFTACDGSIETTVTAANAFTLSWSSVPAGFASALDDIGPLCAATYVLTATDDVTGCQAILSIEITEPQVFDLPGAVSEPTCFGGTGIIDITPSGGTLPYTFDWDNDGTGDFDDLEDLTEVDGTYTVNGLDALGCPATGTFTITEPTEITTVTSSAPSTDCITPDGSVTVVAGGGTPGVLPNDYTYLWTDASTGAAVGNTATAPGLMQGCYNVAVTDGNLCVVSDVECFTSLVTPPITFTQTDVTCFGLSNGTITITSVTSGDSLFYTSGPMAIANNDLNPTGLIAGQYTVEDTENGCTSSAVIDILEPLDITIDETLLNPACAAAFTGSIDIAINDAIGGTTVVWTGPNGYTSTDEDISLLEAGQYCVTVTAGNGCTAIACYDLNDNPVLTITTSSLPSSCSIDDGSVSVVATGGVAAIDYTYLWEDVLLNNEGATATVAPLGADTYTVTVTDDLGCTATGSETLSNSNAPTITLVSQNDITCFGDNDGGIFVNVSGGTLPYASFLWSQSGATTQNLTPAGPGLDTLTVTDAAGCVATYNDSIMEPLLLDVTGVETDLNCFGDGLGAVDITVSGGTLPYASYSWSNQVPQVISGNEDINGLSGGTYDVVVTDANGCTAVYSGVVNEPTEIDLTPGFINSSCASLDGEVSVTAIGGSGVYTYNWEDVLNPGVSLGTNDVLPLMPAGSYEVVVDDGVCSDSITIAISDATGPSVTSAITNVVCDGDGSGAIDLTVVEVGLTFVWTGPGGFVDPGIEDISGLDGGTYTVLVTNVAGCSTSEVIVVGGPTGPIATLEVISDLTCFDDASGAIDLTTTGGTPSLITGYTFAWSGPNGFTSTFEDISLLDSGAYDLVVTDSNLCNFTVTYNVTQPDSIALNATVVDATCGQPDGSIGTAAAGGDGNYTYTWTDLTGAMVFPGSNPSEGSLPAGIYEVVVSDGDGCSTTENLTVTDANGAPLATVISDVNCNGDDDGAIDLTITGASTYTIAWTGPNGFTSTLEDISLLEPGTYNVLVTDDVLPNCVSALSVDVLEPTVLDISGLDTNLFCFAGMDGSIDITVSGGTPIIPSPDYTYSWTSTNGNFIDPATEDLIGLDTGLYQVTATDLNGCTIATQFTITQPASMVLASVVTQDDCFQGGNGAIDITVTQGTTPYTYNWSWTGNTSNNEDLTNLFTDTYTLSIVDSNLCQKDTTFFISEPSPIFANVTVIDANCTFPDGSATSNTVGGAGGYIYSWSSGTFEILLQPSGVYPLTINDANGCQLDTTVTINDIGGPTITIDNITDATCFGSNDGSVDVTISGGNGAPYIFLWNPNAFSQVEDLANAPADVYTYQVTDALGCNTFETATINEPAEISATYSTVVATCGICNGEATVTALGGSGTYTYIWSDNQTTQTATGLCAGVQTVQITDFNNCVSNIDVAVSSDAPGTETILTTDVTCFGGNDGTAEAVPVGGATPYTYFWPHNGSTSNPISNLSAGNYFVEVSDANDCVHVIEAIISESTVITSDVLITPSTCGGSDGAITTTIAGGSGAYTYLWSTADVTPDISVQPEGVYSLTVDDGTCSITEIYTIPGIGAPEVDLSTAPTNCYNDATGSIFSTVTNNVGVVTYQWYDAASQIVFATADIINSLPQGVYSVEVFDPGTGCTGYATTVITSPDSIVLSIPTIIDASCAGICDGEGNVIASGGTLPYTYTWTGNSSTGPGATGLCAGADTVIITDAKFCTLSSEVIINEPIAVSIVTDSITDAFCVNTTDGAIYITANGGDGNYIYNWVSIPAGFTATTDDITGLLPMDYDLTITDGNGCIYTDTIPVDTLNILIANAGLDSNVCEGSCIDLIGTATGTATFTLEWFDMAGTSVGTTDTLQYCPTAAILESYVLVATDISCTYSDTVDVLVNPLPIVDAGPDYIEIYGTTVVLGGSPTATDGTFSWTPTTNFTDTSGTDANPEMSVYDDLEYVVTVIDSNGCVNSDTVNVEIFPEILFPNGFSPNGDGINDTWQIDLISEFPEAVVEVYNRWGQQLFISVGYVQQFDGTNEGKDLPVGTYYYIIVLNHPEYPDAFTGPITIMR